MDVYLVLIFFLKTVGRSVAVFFAREGCDVTIVHLEEEKDDAADTKALVEKAGRKCFCIAVDLRKEENCKSVIDQHIATYGKLNILVNNHAKQIQCKWMQDMKAESIQDSFQVNIQNLYFVIVRNSMLIRYGF